RPVAPRLSVGARTRRLGLPRPIAFGATGRWLGPPPTSARRPPILRAPVRSAVFRFRRPVAPRFSVGARARRLGLPRPIALRATGRRLGPPATSARWAP